NQKRRRARRPAGGSGGGRGASSARRGVSRGARELSPQGVVGGSDYRPDGRITGLPGDQIARQDRAELAGGGFPQCEGRPGGPGREPVVDLPRVVVGKDRPAADGPDFAGAGREGLDGEVVFGHEGFEPTG